MRELSRVYSYRWMYTTVEIYEPRRPLPVGTPDSDE
jgi:hypothetical protein